MARLGEGVLRRWSGLTEPMRLRRMTREAAAKAERMTAVASALPVANIPRPLHTDWAWRPAPWAEPMALSDEGGLTSGSALTPELKIFLDCRRAEVSVRQIDARQGVGAGWALAIELAEFEGSYLSLALDLPAAALAGLTRDYLVRVGVDAQAAGASVFARLNLRHGPNVSQSVCRIGEAGHADLDLAASDMDASRLEGGWVDLIFEAPRCGRLVVEDVTLSRRPRAVL